MTLDGGIDLGTAAASPTQVAIGANSFRISLFGTEGNIPPAKSGIVVVPTTYNMASNGTITAAAMPVETLSFPKINYSIGCPVTGTIPLGCPANPIVVNATLNVPAGTTAGTSGTLTVVARPGADSGVNADTTPAVGYVRFGVAAPTNATPTVAAAISGESSVTEGDTETYSITASDDGALSYAWSVVSGNASILGAADGSSVSVSFTDGPSTVQLKVIVSDGTNPAVERTLTITEFNAVPTGSVSATPSSVTEGSAVTVSVAGATDPSATDAASLKYSFACDGLTGSLATTYVAAGTGNSTSCTLPDNGTYTFRARVIDKDGGYSDYSGSASATNVDPTATFSADSPIDEGSSSTLALTNGTDASAIDAASLKYAFACNASTVSTAYAAAVTSSSNSCTFDDNGTSPVAGKILDKDGGSNTYSTSVVVNNVDPTATFNTPTASVDEGSSFTISLSNPSDPSLADRTAGFTYQFDCGSGTFSTASPASSATCSAIDNPGQTVQGKILDKDGGSTTYNGTVTVNNVAPSLVITGPLDGALYAVNTQVAIVAPFSDPGTNDTHTCTVSWDDGATPTTYAASSGTCNTSRTFFAAGVYTITITVDDGEGGTSTDSVGVVVYDPSAGFVTGGGWILSPAGAYRADQNLAGKATFGFVSKYKKGATVPTGQTEFHFQAGNFRFFSDTYQWLVVSGPKAQYKGTGSVNGQSGYSFLLTLTDGQVNGGGGTDKFRIKITDTSGVLVYDNVVGASDDMDQANPQQIGGGSIVIHTGK